MITFTKYTGAGNDFIIIDNRNSVFPSDNRLFITQLCRRHTGIGADGIILIENSVIAAADFRLRIFNADGSEAEMCGNGARCAIKYLAERTPEKKSYHLETLCGIIVGHVVDEEVLLVMPQPTDISWHQQITCGATSYTIHSLDTGVPHAVLFVENVHEIDIASIGPQLRHHSAFAPKGANIDFVSIDANANANAKELLRLRTWERGVEGETLACGTGATAAAIAATVIKEWKPPIHVKVSSEDILTVNFLDTLEITLQGPATKIYEGTFNS